MCVICGFIYDEDAGLPDEGIAPGTKWDDIPLNWSCPDCGASKEDFEMVEIWILMVVMPERQKPAIQLAFVLLLRTT